MNHLKNLTSLEIRINRRTLYQCPELKTLEEGISCLLPLAFVGYAVDCARYLTALLLCGLPYNYHILLPVC